MAEMKMMMQCWGEQLFSLLGKKVRECTIIVTSMTLNEAHPTNEAILQHKQQQLTVHHHNI